jgi:DNA-directed RNA polymerase subunit RPC12/RpoP
MTTKPVNHHGEFTKKAKKGYLDGKCPYCGSGVYGFDGKEIADDFVISHRISCSDCKRQWWEVYEMRSIEPIS